MLGLIIKDILNLRKILKTSLLILAFFSLLAYESGNPSYLMGMFVLILTMQFISSISYDEVAKWNVYALTMPISRVKLILSKYILSVSLSIIALIMSTTISYFLILPKTSMSQLEFFLVSYIIFAISILLLSVLIPLIYKFGVERSRLLLFVVLGIPTLLIIYLNKKGIKLPDMDELVSLFKISPIILILSLIVSFYISYRIYKKIDI